MVIANGKQKVFISNNPELLSFELLQANLGTVFYLLYNLNFF